MRIEKIPISFKIIVTLLLVIAAGIVFGGSVSFVMAAGSSGYPEHEPYGNGVGAMPGRVVWFHDKDSVEWDGNGYWWVTANFDESAIQKMVDQGIAGYSICRWEKVWSRHIKRGDWKLAYGCRNSDTGSGRVQP